LGKARLTDPAPRIAIIGDRGIPAKYSGFSTLVEELGTRLVGHHGMRVTVYCRNQYYETRPAEYKGVRCVYLPAPGGKSFESIVSSNFSIWHAALVGRHDLAFIVDPGNGPFVLPLLLRRVPVVMHTDGLGWQRTKWSRIQRAYYRWSERATAALSTWLVTDSRIMQEYYRDEYAAPSSFIPYGARTGDPGDAGALRVFGVEPGRYLLAVARMEPENNLDLIIREYQKTPCGMPLLVIGGVRYESEYARRTMAMADARVSCPGNVFDAPTLNALYSNCFLYVHGHQVGGTNPSLLRAMGAGAACLPIDVPFHREVLGEGQSEYFSKEPGSLGSWINTLEHDRPRVASMARRARDRAEAFYRWDAVAAAYAELFEAVIEARRKGTPFRPPAGFEPYRPGGFGGGPGGAKTGLGGPAASGTATPGV
jgi:glycosyltransferase involved in cell wall biosynthesis